MGGGPGKDQLEQRQAVHGHALHQLFLQECKKEFGEWNFGEWKTGRQGKTQLSRVTGNKTHACN